MGKYKYSSLTDEQHEKIMRTIGLITINEKDEVAKYLENRIRGDIIAIRRMGPISMPEALNYIYAIQTAVEARKELRYGNLSER